MAYKASFLSLVSLTCIASGFTACGFGDDQKGQSIEVDAPPADAMPIDAMPIDAMPMAKVFEVMPIPPTPIPDNDLDGVSIPFTVTGVTATTGLDVQVDVTHTFSGDVLIELLRGANVVKILRPRMGGATDNIKATFTVTPAELGTPLNDSYAVRFSDDAANDLGTISLVRLTFKVN